MRKVLLLGAAMSWLFACSTSEPKESLSDESGLFEEVQQAGTMGPVNGEPNFCTAGAKCSSGQGDCNTNNQCQTGLVCVLDKGAQFSFAPQVDICLPATCGNGMQDGGESGVDCGGDCGMCPAACSGTFGAGDFCSALCKCDVGEGDCDTDKQCMPGLTCVADTGQSFDLPRTTDMCLATHCTNGMVDSDELGVDCGGEGCAPCPANEGPPGNPTYCSATNPCTAGFGDCDGSIECVDGTHCQLNVGPNYGYAAWVDVCETNAAIQTDFAYTGTVQTYVVPPGVTRLLVDVAGAQGGGTFNGAGGLGARVTGRIAVQPGDMLSVVVGEQGHNPGDGNHPENSSGGGGGSFIYLNTTLFAAAGGGGGRCNYTSAQALHSGAAGQSTKNGGAGLDAALGGLNGQGGAAGFWSSEFSAGGGAGWLSAGGGGAAGGLNATGNWAGGQPVCTGGGPGCGGVGGFGGGGGGGDYYGGGGGGGGYSGGGGGTDPTHGGGGGSTLKGTNAVITSGFQTGNGSVSIITN